MQPDEQAVLESHIAWIAAVNAGDIAQLLGLMTDDAVFLNPGQAPCGKDAFPVGFTAGHQRNHIRCISEPQEIVVVGDVAHTLCKDSLTVTPRAGGPTVSLAGYRLTIYRKRDGRWLLARDAHTVS